MPTRVLETVLTGRDQLSPVLAKAAASTEAFENKVEDSNTAAARSSTNAARIHQAAAQATTDAARQIHGARGDFEAAGADLGDALAGGLVRDAGGRLRNSRGQFASDAEKALAGIDPVAEKRGQDSGGRLARGISMGVTRNSPLIVAAISAALIAGAPAAIAGATALFAGIGAVAAAQNVQVRSAWLDTFHQIRDGAVADAQQLVPVFVSAASQIGSAFQRMRPMLSDAFAAAGPQITMFVGSLTSAAQLALPGLVHAIQNATPVTQGLGKLMESIGSGISEFFDAIAQHGPAAGQAFSALGNILHTLLPLLGTLLGEGAELASAVLPPLASVLHVVAGALEAIAPILPAVVTGFAAFKLVTALSGPLSLLSAKLQTVAADGGKLTTALAGNAASAVTKLGSALPLLGAALGLFGALLEEESRQTNEWAQALIAGGSAAAQARAEMTATSNAIASQTTGFMGFVNDLSGAGNVFRSYGSAVTDVKDRQRELLDQMGPLAAAQERQRQAQIDVNAATDKYGPSSAQANEALQRYKTATADVEYQQGLLETAIHGVTQAMIDQANQALAAIDSGFAMQQAAINTQRAIENLAATQADSKATALDLQQANLDVATAFKSEADQIAQHQADLSGLTEGTAEYTRFIQEHTLGALESLRGQFPQFGPVIDGMIGQLQNAGVAVTDLGNMQAAPTLSVDDQQLHDALARDGLLLSQFGFLTPTPTADLNSGPLYIKVGGATDLLGVLAGQRPTPTADLNPNPFNINWHNVSNNLDILAAQHPTPTVGLNDQASGPAQSIKNLIASIQSKIVTVTVRQSVVGALTGIAAAAGGGASGGIMRPRPMATGGILPLAPGGVAGVYAPNAPILIGDNRRVPESYTPWDGSGRSWEVVRRTVAGMVAATGYRPPDFAAAAMPGYGSGGGRGGMAGAVSVGLSLAGAVITGQFRLDSDGMVRLVDGRIEGRLGDIADYAHYNS